MFSKMDGEKQHVPSYVIGMFNELPEEMIREISRIIIERWGEVYYREREKV
jgi:hypothetical protein